MKYYSPSRGTTGPTRRDVSFPDQLGFTVDPTKADPSHLDAVQLEAMCRKLQKMVTNLEDYIDERDKLAEVADSFTEHIMVQNREMSLTMEEMHRSMKNYATQIEKEFTNYKTGSAIREFKFEALTKVVRSLLNDVRSSRDLSKEATYTFLRLISELYATSVAAENVERELARMREAKRKWSITRNGAVKCFRRHLERICHRHRVDKELAENSMGVFSDVLQQAVGCMFDGDETLTDLIEGVKLYSDMMKNASGKERNKGAEDDSTYSADESRDSADGSLEFADDSEGSANDDGKSADRHKDLADDSKSLADSRRNREDRRKSSDCGSRDSSGISRNAEHAIEDKLHGSTESAHIKRGPVENGKVATNTADPGEAGQPNENETKPRTTVAFSVLHRALQRSSTAIAQYREEIDPGCIDKESTDSTVAQPISKPEDPQGTDEKKEDPEEAVDIPKDFEDLKDTPCSRPQETESSNCDVAYDPFRLDTSSASSLSADSLDSNELNQSLPEEDKDEQVERSNTNSDIKGKEHNPKAGKVDSVSEQETEQVGSSNVEDVRMGPTSPLANGTDLDFVEDKINMLTIDKLDGVGGKDQELDWIDTNLDSARSKASSCPSRTKGGSDLAVDREVKEKEERLTQEHMETSGGSLCFKSRSEGLMKEADDVKQSKTVYSVEVSGRERSARGTQEVSEVQRSEKDESVQLLSRSNSMSSTSLQVALESKCKESKVLGSESERFSGGVESKALGLDPERFSGARLSVSDECLLNRTFTVSDTCGSQEYPVAQEVASQHSMKSISESDHTKEVEEMTVSLSFQKPKSARVKKEVASNATGAQTPNSDGGQVHKLQSKEGMLLHGPNSLDETKFGSESVPSASLIDTDVHDGPPTPTCPKSVQEPRFPKGNTSTTRTPELVLTSDSNVVQPDSNNVRSHGSSITLVSQLDTPTDFFRDFIETSTPDGYIRNDCIDQKESRQSRGTGQSQGGESSIERKMSSKLSKRTESPHGGLLSDVASIDLKGNASKSADESTLSLKGSSSKTTAVQGMPKQNPKSVPHDASISTAKSRTNIPQGTGLIEENEAGLSTPGQVPPEQDASSFILTGRTSEDGFCQVTSTPRNSPKSQTDLTFTVSAKTEEPKKTIQAKKSKKVQPNHKEKTIQDHEDCIKGVSLKPSVKRTLSSSPFSSTLKSTTPSPTPPPKVKTPRRANWRYSNVKDSPKVLPLPVPSTSKSTAPTPPPQTVNTPKRVNRRYSNIKDSPKVLPLLSRTPRPPSTEKDKLLVKDKVERSAVESGRVGRRLKFGTRGEQQQDGTNPRSGSRAQGTARTKTKSSDIGEAKNRTENAQRVEDGLRRRAAESQGREKREEKNAREEPQQDNTNTRSDSTAKGITFTRTKTKSANKAENKKRADTQSVEDRSRRKATDGQGRQGREEVNKSTLDGKEAQLNLKTEKGESRTRSQKGSQEETKCKKNCLDGTEEQMKKVLLGMNEERSGTCKEGDRKDEAEGTATEKLVEKQEKKTGERGLRVVRKGSSEEVQRKEDEIVVDSKGTVCGGKEDNRKGKPGLSQGSGSIVVRNPEKLPSKLADEECLKEKEDTKSSCNDPEEKVDIKTGVARETKAEGAPRKRRGKEKNVQHQSCSGNRKEETPRRTSKGGDKRESVSPEVKERKSAKERRARPKGHKKPLSLHDLQKLCGRSTPQKDILVPADARVVEVRTEEQPMKCCEQTDVQDESSAEVAAKEKSTQNRDHVQRFEEKVLIGRSKTNKYQLPGAGSRRLEANSVDGSHPTGNLDKGNVITEKQSIHRGVHETEKRGSELADEAKDPEADSMQKRYRRSTKGGKSKPFVAKGEQVAQTTTAGCKPRSTSLAHLASQRVESKDFTTPRKTNSTGYNLLEVKGEEEDLTSQVGAAPAAASNVSRDQVKRFKLPSPRRSLGSLGATQGGNPVWSKANRPSEQKDGNFADGGIHPHSGDSSPSSVVRAGETKSSYSLAISEISEQVEELMVSKSLTSPRGSIELDGKVKFSNNGQLFKRATISLPKLNQCRFVEGTVARSNTPVLSDSAQEKRPRIRERTVRKQVSLPAVKSDARPDTAETPSPRISILKYRKSSLPRLPNIADPRNVKRGKLDRRNEEQSRAEKEGMDSLPGHLDSPRV